MAWQFDRPDKGDGLVQAFRRSNNDESVRIFRLNGLAPRARYSITDFDAGERAEMSGRDLMEKGLKIEIKNNRAQW